MAIRAFDGLGDRLARSAQSLDVGFDRLDLRLEAFDDRLEVSVDGRPAFPGLLRRSRSSQ
jgi:hypothetical protein